MPRPSPSLLLLPAPPVPVAFAAAYRPTFASVLSTLKSLPTSTELLIVLPCPSVHGRLNVPRSAIYEEVQLLLGSLYSLFCVVCAQKNVDVDSGLPGSVDARVILLDYTGHTPQLDQPANYDNFTLGPVVDLASLALTRRSWNYIFSVDGESGQQLLASFNHLASQTSPPVQGTFSSVEGGVSIVDQASVQASVIEKSAKLHNVVAVGGTFDHIHAGHKLLLTATALLLQPSKYPRRLIVGITGDELLKNKKYPQYLGSWKQRQDDVVQFLLSVLLFTMAGTQESIRVQSFDSPVPNGRAIHTTLIEHNLTIECAEIQDPFGPTITDENVTALVVSAETRSGGQAVNDKRTAKGWKALEVFEIDVLDAQDIGGSPQKTENFASKISSTAIRKRMAESGRTSSL